MIRPPQEVHNDRKRKDHENDVSQQMDFTGLNCFPDLNFGLGSDEHPATLWEGLNMESWKGTELDAYLQDLDSVWGGILPGSSSSSI